MTIYTKAYPAPRVDEKEILRYAGIAKNKTPPDELLRILRECLAEIEGGLSFRACYCELPIIREGDVLDLGFIRTESQALKKNLADCDAIILFAVTVGITPDRLIAKYSRLSPTKALLFQAIGAERVEALCEALCSDLAQQYKRKGCSLRPRFSAGFADLPLAVQRDIFNTLSPEKRIGVTLGKNMLMSPTKSVTALIGISKT